MDTTLFLTLIWVNLLALMSAQNSICFYANWAQYRKNEGRFMPADIDVSLCSHITYAHLMIDLDTHQLVQKQKNDHVLLGQLVALKAIKPSLKIILSVGGWNHEKFPRFSRMVQNKEARAAFIESTISYMTLNLLDGLSIDWEYPTHRGTSIPEDKERFTLLLKEIREAYAAQNLPFTLSASVSAGRKIISTAYEIPKIIGYLDWVNVMAYALHGGWEDETGHHTATKGGIPNVPDCLNAWLEAGMPSSKINLGLATYGRSFTLLFPDENDLGAPVNGTGTPGLYTRGKGIMSYYEICNVTWSKKTSWSESAAGKPYASVGDQWIGYETPASVRQPVLDLVNKKCLHGIAVWALGYDDFSGTFCHEGRFPLVRSAVEAMNTEMCEF